jgi:hypothetical protein
VLSLLVLFQFVFLQRLSKKERKNERKKKRKNREFVHIVINTDAFKRNQEPTFTQLFVFGVIVCTCMCARVCACVCACVTDARSLMTGFSFLLMRLRCAAALLYILLNIQPIHFPP